MSHLRSKRAGPLGGLVADSAGNLYGTVSGGVDGKVKIDGTVFELTPTTTGWTETVLLTGTRTLGTFMGGVIPTRPLTNSINQSWVPHFSRVLCARSGALDFPITQHQRVRASG